MSNDTNSTGDDAVEVLLGKAPPRLVPPETDAAAVRDAVRDEWLEVTARRRRRARTTQWAMAASVLLAIVVTASMLDDDGLEPVQVATIDKQFGTITVFDQNAEALQQDFAAITVGQSVSTRSDAAIGLSWAGGGSLRIDENSRVEFVSDDGIVLHEGRVYFDSSPALSAGNVPVAAAPFKVQTEHGTVEHIGTQYMAQTDRQALTISVREGEVVVRSANGNEDRAVQLQQMAISGSGVRSIVNVPRYGEIWRWVELVTPSASLDGRTVEDFLAWVSHETGLTVRYESDGTRFYAERETLIGRLETTPREALDFWLPGTNLDWRIDNGVIYVSESR